MRLVRGLIVLLVVCACAKLAAPDARAASPLTVSFTEAGAHSFAVPAGVTSIHVVAVGAPGGSQGAKLGGAGGTATADVSVTPGQVLQAFVGGPGGPGGLTGTSIALGGFNGGGNGGAKTKGGGGGGGASDLRTGGAEEFTTRLVVAAGGGGAGYNGRGGDAGQAAETVAKLCEGGGPGSAGAGGKGGIGFEEVSGESSVFSGESGTLGKGGSGYTKYEGSYGGGGGGGGLYGGGAGGGAGQEGPGIVTCGGGGGSSGFGPGTSLTSISSSASRTASVTISYEPPATPPGGPSTPGGSEGSPTTPKAKLSLPSVQHGTAVVGTVAITANRSLLKARLFWSKPSDGKAKRLRAGKRIIVGALTEAPLKKGLHSFTVKLNKRGVSALQMQKNLKLTLEVKVTPPRGAAASARKSVTLKR